MHIYSYHNGPVLLLCIVPMGLMVAGAVEGTLSINQSIYLFILIAYADIFLLNLILTLLGIVN